MGEKIVEKNRESKNCWEKLPQHVKPQQVRANYHNMQKHSRFNNREKIVQKNKRDKKNTFWKNKLIDSLRREKKVHKIMH
jgi:hypothetical protein